MKLLFLIESMAPESGGPAIEVVWLTDMLLRQTDIEVTVASLTPIDRSLPLHPDIHYVQFDNPVFPRRSWLRAIGDLRQLIREHDVLFTSGIWGPVDGFALRLAWQQHKPVYIRVCGMLEPYILTRSPLKKQLARLLYLRHNLRLATGLIVNSESEARNVRKAGVISEKILVIPNGVQPVGARFHQFEARRSLGLDAHRPVLLYLSRLHPKKGLHVLLQAMALLPTHKRNFSLLVAGEYSDTRYQAQIERLIIEGSLQSMVHFSGLVTGINKELHFQAADSFILPSQSEGLPNAVLEAMAHGLPVIVTKGCNLPEVITHKAGLVLELSVANLTRALDWFMMGGTVLSVASQGAQRLVKERFNVEQTLHEYQRILVKHRPNSARERNVNLANDGVGNQTGH